MIEINGITYRNIQQQVAKNTDDIDKLKKEGIGGSSYEAGTGIDITNNTISIDNTVVATKSDLPNMNNYVSKVNLWDSSINQIVVGNSEIEPNNVDLRALYSQDVKSEISAEPTSTIIRTMSGTDVSTIGISATEIDVTTPMLKYGTSEVAVKSDIPVVEKKTLVWTNPSPTSGFDPQVSNPELDMTGITNPKYLEIEWKDSSSTNGIRINRFGWIDTGAAYNYLSQINMNSTATYITGRRFYISKVTELNKTYAMFDDAYRSVNFQTASANNSNIIPYKIYVIE